MALMEVCEVDDEVMDDGRECSDEKPKYKRFEVGRMKEKHVGISLCLQDQVSPATRASAVSPPPRPEAEPYKPARRPRQQRL